MSAIGDPYCLFSAVASGCKFLIGWAVKLLVTYWCALSKKQYMTMTGNEAGLSPRAMGRGFPLVTFMGLGSMKENRTKSNSCMCHSCSITHLLLLNEPENLKS